MAGTVGSQLAALSSVPSALVSGVAQRPHATGHDDGPLMLVPAGFVGNILGGLSGTIGEITGGFFGNAPLGRKIGDASSPLVKLLPFQVIAPDLQPQSSSPDNGGQDGVQEPLVVVPSAFLGGLLGGIGGNLLGGTIGSWFGNTDTGRTIGSTVGGVVGGLLPFEVVPPAMLPQSAGPDGIPVPQEPMVVVPSGFFGNLLGGLSGTVGNLIGGRTGRQIGDTASPFLKMLPFQDVPPDLLPQSAGPGGAVAEQERMIFVPAGFFGSLLSGLAGTVGGAVGGLFGNAQAGQTIGAGVAPVLDLIPFHAVPPALLPQAAGPTPGTAGQEEMMLVPAGLFGSLLSGLAGTVGGVVGGIFGHAKTGTDIGNAAAPFLGMLPFQTVAPASAS